MITDKSAARPRWEEEVEFTRPPRKTKVTYVARPATRTVSETIIRERPGSPIIHTASPPPPPRSIRAPSPQPLRIELVSVEEGRSESSGPRTSRASVSNKGKSKRGSSRGGSDRGEIEEYIERERIRERMPPPSPEPRREEYETYRYVEAPRVEQERIERRRSRSITYESNPRLSGRLVERERVVVEDGGRRREYYRRP